MKFILNNIHITKKKHFLFPLSIFLYLPSPTFFSPFYLHSIHKYSNLQWQSNGQKMLLILSLHPCSHYVSNYMHCNQDWLNYCLKKYPGTAITLWSFEKSNAFKMNGSIIECLYIVTPEIIMLIVSVFI